MNKKKKKAKQKHLDQELLRALKKLIKAREKYTAILRLVRESEYDE
jgi:hypothetical protein